LGTTDIVDAPVDMPVFFWIADHHRAVFVVQAFGGKAEYGFVTSDESLVGALIRMRDRYRHPSATRP
jgi:hypothetical protein